MVTHTRRSTTDIVVIIFALMISVLMVILGLGLIYVKMKMPSLDIKSASELFGNVVTTVVGALVGFIGGRATGKYEAMNGKEE